MSVPVFFDCGLPLARVYTTGKRKSRKKSYHVSLEDRTLTLCSRQILHAPLLLTSLACSFPSFDIGPVRPLFEAEGFPLLWKIFCDEACETPVEDPNKAASDAPSDGGICDPTSPLR